MEIGVGNMQVRNKKRKSNNEAFVKGTEDFRTGRVRNPYRPRSHYFKEWERGFNTAYHDNLAI